MRRLARLAAAGAVACGVLAAPVLGQGTAPQPGCAGLYSDRKGDAEPANLDITGFWFKTEAGRTKAYLRIADLNPSLPPDATGANWYILWNVQDVQYFVTASVEVTAPEPAFTWGTVEETPSGTLRQAEAEIAGTFGSGPDGVIEFEVPPEAGAASGTVFTSPIADTATSTGFIFSLLATIDEATGRNYTVNGCESAAPTPTPTPAPPPGGGTHTTGAPGQLDLALAGKPPRARKVKRRLSLKVRSEKGVSDLKATLYRGNVRANRVVAKGSAASVPPGTRRLKLKVSKKLKKGSYTLYAAGKNSDGVSSDRQIKLRLR